MIIRLEEFSNQDNLLHKYNTSERYRQPTIRTHMTRSRSNQSQHQFDQSQKGQPPRPSRTSPHKPQNNQSLDSPRTQPSTLNPSSILQASKIMENRCNILRIPRTIIHKRRLRDYKQPRTIRINVTPTRKQTQLSDNSVATSLTIILITRFEAPR